MWSQNDRGKCVTNKMSHMPRENAEICWEALWCSSNCYIQAAALIMNQRGHILTLWLYRIHRDVYFSRDFSNCNNKLPLISSSSAASITALASSLSKAARNTFIPNSHQAEFILYQIHLKMTHPPLTCDKGYLTMKCKQCVCVCVRAISMMC